VQDNFSLANRDFSFWEIDTLKTHYDFIIIGAGLVGLSTALSLREKYKTANILIVERSIIPYGASTRNAGFACFGSVTEIIDDINRMSVQDVSQLLHDRWKGLQMLRDRVGDQNMEFHPQGGYEIFKTDDDKLYVEPKERIGEINTLIRKSIGLANCFSIIPNSFGFKTHSEIIYNQYEAQLHPGKMMERLLHIVQSHGIKILSGVNVDGYESSNKGISVSVNNTREFNLRGSQLFITTNAFVNNIVDGIDLKPGRNQVLITKPIKNLKLKGCFHYDKGFVYFRNYKDRLLIGGGRNIALDAETTEVFGVSTIIQEYLRTLIREVILPDTSYEEDRWWSGIIATGSSKEPIISSLSSNVHMGVRLSGMGVALGSLIGDKLSNLV